MEFNADVEKQRQLQCIVNDYFHNLQCSNTLIIPFTDINMQMVSVKLADCPIEVALARGLRINKDNFSFLGILNPFNGLGDFAIGDIFIDRNWIDNILSDNEINFLLAHELAHIYYNHQLSDATSNLIIKLFEELIQSCDELVKAKASESIKEGKDANAMLISWEIIKKTPQIIEKCKYNLWGELPLNAVRTKEKEIEADFLAVSLIKDKNSAISCLEKLVAYDLDKASHSLGFLNNSELIFTMRQRIDEIKKIIFNEEEGQEDIKFC